MAHHLRLALTAQNRRPDTLDGLFDWRVPAYFQPKVTGNRIDPGRIQGHSAFFNCSKDVFCSLKLGRNRGAF